MLKTLSNVLSLRKWLRFTAMQEQGTLAILKRMVLVINIHQHLKNIMTIAAIRESETIASIADEELINIFMIS